MKTQSNFRISIRDTFEQFLGWLYTDCIDLRRQNGEWMSLCKLWVLAEKLQVRPQVSIAVMSGYSRKEDIQS
jgi:hypothetical protein